MVPSRIEHSSLAKHADQGSSSLKGRYTNTDASLVAKREISYWKGGFVGTEKANVPPLIITHLAIFSPTCSVAQNMEYDECAVEGLYQVNLSSARQLLGALVVAEGREPKAKGLNGWVYEQTVRYCLSQELEVLGITPVIKDQVSLCGRAKIDLLVGRVAVEIKALGSFGDDARKYSGYRTKVEARGWVYLYLTRSETYRPYRMAAESAFGKNRAFFLDTEGHWERFISEIIGNLNQGHNNSIHRVAKKMGAR
jgi:hypothetical protein